VKGVEEIRVKYHLHAYCTQDGCTFDRRAGHGHAALAIRNDAQRHALQHGHRVVADILDRTTYAPGETS
jgi:hypothetical protein